MDNVTSNQKRKKKMYISHIRIIIKLYRKRRRAPESSWHGCKDRKD